ncbi:MAG: RluA family pseudouridine synthase [Chloroflexota bacterium]|nr:RluA family pseudouridine synthase [Chloroflexota bacterium]
MPTVRSFPLAVERECAGERLDRFLATKLPQFTRAYLQTRIEHADVQVDGRLRKASFRLRGGEQIAVAIPDEPSRTTLIPEQMSLVILYEDADVIVVDKPAGLVVHPGAGNWTGTLVHGILAHSPDVRTNDAVRPGIVHRLDKETSGALIVAKHDVAREFLAQQLRERTAHKEYTVLVHGIVPRDVTINAPIGRDPVHRTRMAVVSNGREATSIVHVVEHLPGCTLLSVDLRSGRTHQIRVHCAYIGHPVAGDRRYALRRTPPYRLTRQFLHAALLEITLPNGERRAFVSSLPDDLVAVLDRLRADP